MAAQPGDVFPSVFYRLGYPLGQSLVYLLRSLVILYLFSDHFLDVFKIYSRNIDVYEKVHFIGQFDIVHRLFLTLLPAAAILLFFPTLKVGLPRFLRYFISATLGLAAVAIPFLVQMHSRPDYRFTGETIVAGLYLFLNLFCFCAVQTAGERRDEGLLKGMKRIPILTDLLFPSLVYKGYESNLAFLRYPLRIVPLVLLVFPWMASTALTLQSIDEIPESFPRFEPVLSHMPSYDYIRVDTDGDLLITYSNQGLCRFSVTEKEITAQNSVSLSGTWRFDLLPEKNEIHALSLLADQVDYAIYDSKTLAILDVRRFTQNGAPFTMGARTFYDPKRNILLAGFEGGMIRIRDDRQGVSYISTTDGYVQLDPKRERLYVTSLEHAYLATLDTTDLHTIHVLQLPQGGDRLAIDSVSDRLYVASPAEGVIRVVDLESFQIIRTIRTFFGLRSMFVDEARRLLIAGGLTPYLEIRDADDYALIDRMFCPPWVRSITTDPDRPVGYLASRHGIYRFELPSTRTRTTLQTLKRFDPFTALFYLVTPVLTHLGGMTTSSPMGAAMIAEPIKIEG